MMNRSAWMRILAVLVVAVVGARGADITPGYTWSSGELVTHSTLNTFGAGSINTTFYSGKSSAGSNPNTAWQILLRDTSSDVFKRTTIADLFDHSGFLSGRVALTTPAEGDLWLVYDLSSTTYKSLALSNLFNAAATTTIDGRSNKWVHLDTLTGTLRTMNFGQLINAAPARAIIGDVDQFLLTDSLTDQIHRSTFYNLINLSTTNTSAAGTDRIPISVGTTPTSFRNVQVSNIIAGASALTTVAGTEQAWVLDGATPKRVAFSAVKTYAKDSYVLLRDEQSSGTPGGGVTNVWSIRRINTVANDASGLVTGPGSTNAWTLPAGVYRFRLVCPGFKVGLHQCMLTNVTDGVFWTGRNARSDGGVDTTSDSEAMGRFTNSAPKVFAVRHRSSALNGTDGGGPATSFGTEIYSTVEFWKED